MKVWCHVMNSRYIDIHKHLPEQEIGSYLEVQNITSAENFMFRKTWDRLVKIQLNRFILTADEVGLSKFEKMMKIKPVGNLEDRRRMVFYIWNRRIIYTVRTLVDMLDDLIGRKRYCLDLETNTFGVRLLIYVGQDQGIDEGTIYNTLREMIPANLTLEIVVFLVDMLQFKTNWIDRRFRFVMCGEINTGVYPKSAYQYFNDFTAKLQIGDANTALTDRYIEVGEIESGGLDDIR